MQITVQAINVHVLAQTHIEVQHRIFRPFRLQLLYRKPGEQILPPFEISMKRACQQRLAEPSGAAQEHILRIDVRHPVNVFRLVDIQITLFPDLRESLYAYRVFSSCRAHDNPLFIPVESKDKKTF